MRAAVAQDAEQVERLRLRTWQAAYREILPAVFLDGLRVQDDQLTRWSDRIQAPDTRALVAVHGENVVGMAVAGRCRDEDLPELRELYALYVDAGTWRAGVGGSLLAAVEPVQVLWVLAANTRARSFYERHGFAIDGASKVLELGAAVVEVRYRR